MSSIVELLKHDFKLLHHHRREIFLVAVVLALIVYFINDYPLLSLLMLHIASILAITNESSGVLINSLATIFITTYLLLIAYFLNKGAHNQYIESPNNILGLFAFAISTLALLMPFGFWFSKHIWIAIMIVFSLVNGFSWVIWDLTLQYTLFFAIVSIILLILSYLMSIQIFNEREFD